MLHRLPKVHTRIIIMPMVKMTQPLNITVFLHVCLCPLKEPQLKQRLNLISMSLLVSNIAMISQAWCELTGEPVQIDPGMVQTNRLAACLVSQSYFIQWVNWPDLCIVLHSRLHKHVVLAMFLSQVG